MGDPRQQRKKYSTPEHPWRAKRLEQEKELSKEYGFRTKKEIWKMESILRNFKKQAKNLIALNTEQSKKEEKQLLNKLIKLNLVKENAKLEDVLGLDIKNILDRRLQTLVYKKGLAKSAKQARQFITHGHILVKDKKLDVPSYLVLANEEDKIKFSDTSKLANEEHPERTVKPKEVLTRKIVKPLKKKTDKVDKRKIKKEVEETKLEVKEKPVEIKKAIENKEVI